MLPTRRVFLSAFLAAPAASLLGSREGQSQEGRLPLTPECRSSQEVTVAQTEGPYFKPDAPLKQDLAADAPAGERMTLAGFVLDTACRPVPRAIVQLWHADETGGYDNRGYKLRGHQFTDEGGRWWFSTIVPAAYPGRTRHFHVKVQRPAGRVLTTQLYFPSEPLNRSDRLFDNRLLMRIGQAADGKLGRYDFVV